MIDFNNIWIDFNCPNCGYADEIQLVDVKSESKVFCHNCKAVIQLIDSEASTHSGIDSITEALKDFERTIKNL